MAYCLGSAILPVSSQLVNDEHWPYPEYGIRCRAVIQEQRSLEQIGYIALPSPLKLQDLRPGKCTIYSEEKNSADVIKTQEDFDIL